jgi:hypothetical protein
MIVRSSPGDVGYIGEDRAEIGRTCGLRGNYPGEDASRPNEVRCPVFRRKLVFQPQEARVKIIPTD